MMHNIVLKFGFLCALALGAPSVMAQEGGREAADRMAEEIENRPIQDFAYSKDKTGCMMRASVFSGVLMNYKRGVPVSEIGNFAIWRPIAEDIYKDIRKDGVAQATLNNMRAIETCVENAEPHSNEETEFYLAKQYKACGAFNKVLFATLESVEKGRKIDAVIQRYGRTKIDWSETPYGSIEDPLVLMIASVYKAAQNGGYENAVSTASTASLGCYQ